LRHGTMGKQQMRDEGHMPPTRADWVQRTR
jgi:hypothetical protein